MGITPTTSRGLPLPGPTKTGSRITLAAGDTQRGIIGCRTSLEHESLAPCRPGSGCRRRTTRGHSSPAAFCVMRPDGRRPARFSYVVRVVILDGDIVYLFHFIRENNLLNGNPTVVVTDEE